MELVNLYICHTYYHLLISIIKQVKCNIVSDIIISSDFYNVNLINDVTLINRLRNSNIFRNVIISDFSKDENLKMKHLDNLNRVRLGYKYRRKKEYNFSKYNEIYIFNDATLMGHILNKQKVKYNLIEDGMDCFKIKYNGFRNKKITIKNRILRLFNVYGMAESSRIKSIEVNDKQNLTVEHCDILECPKHKLFSSLNDKEKQLVFNIFVDQHNNLQELADGVLILTQPLNEDKICGSEEDKINIYKDVIKEYAKNENVILKTHPRENTDYLKYFKDCKNIKLITEKFPVEVLLFSNIRIKKIITIFSTSINMFEPYEGNIELGYEYINNKMER